MGNDTEVLLRQSRYDETMELLEDFKRRDPKSNKTDQFRKQVKKLQSIADEIRELEKQRKDGKIDVKVALRLAALYLQVNRRKEFETIIADILKVKQFPPEVYLRAATLLTKVRNTGQARKALALCESRIGPETNPKMLLSIATLYAQSKQIAPAEKTMAEYLRRSPRDWKAWLDLGTMQISLKKNNEALNSLQQAVNNGGRSALQIINRDRHFAPFRNKIRSPVARPAPLLDLPGLPSTSAPIGTRTQGR